jgi:hypothetical protein
MSRWCSPSHSSRALVVAALTAIALLPSVASAQTTAGIKGGVNFNNVDFTQNDIPDEFLPDFKRRAGIVAGVFVGRDFNARAGVQIEALFSQKATKADLFDIEGVPVDTTFTVNYLEIPVLFNARVGNNDQAAFRVYAGPSFAFKLSDSVEIAGVELDEDSGLKSYDAGIVVGASVTIRKFVIDGRYTHGFVNLEDDEPDVINVKNRTITFMIGYAFK